MIGSPVGPFVGSSWRRQTMIHVVTFNMSDRVALNGRTARKPVWRLNCPYLNLDACANVPASAPASRSRITTKLLIKQYISNTTTLILGQKSPGNKFKQDLTNCQDNRQDCSFLSNSTWLVHKPAYQAVLYPRKARNRLV